MSDSQKLILRASLVYAFLAGAVMLPLFQPGFVFLLDMMWAPWVDVGVFLENGVQPGFVFTLVFHILSSVIPLSVIQKVILLTLLFAAGILVCTFTRCVYQYFLENDSQQKTFFSKPDIWAILAGGIYMINPWVYERMLAGQWFVLAGYAFYPLLLLLTVRLIDFVTTHTLLQIFRAKQLWYFVLCLAVYPIFSIHWTYIGVWSVVVIGSLYLMSRLVDNHGYSRKMLYTSLKAGARALVLAVVILLVFVTTNFFWLQGFFDTSSTYRSISRGDFEAFATVADTDFGVYFNAASLYGFWSTDYVLPKESSAGWWVMSLVIIVVSVLGSMHAYYKKDSLLRILSLLYIPVLILAVGYGHPFSERMTNVVLEYVPAYRGLRETQKLVGILAFLYAVFFPLGAYTIVSWCRKQFQGRVSDYMSYGFLTVFVVLVLLNTHSIFWGFDGQVKARDYPSGWYEVDTLLQEDQSDRRVLFLPWHGYMPFSFTGNHVVSNPAGRFFHADIVASESIENIYVGDTDPVYDQTIFELVHGQSALAQKRDFFEVRSVTHILLAKEHDWQRYGFLEESEVLEVVFEDESVVLYRLK